MNRAVAAQLLSQDSFAAWPKKNLTFSTPTRVTTASLYVYTCSVRTCRSISALEVLISDYEFAAEINLSSMYFKDKRSSHATEANSQGFAVIGSLKLSMMLNQQIDGSRRNNKVI